MFKNPTERYRNIALLFGSMLTVMGGLAIAPGIAGMGQHFADVPNAELLVKLVITIPSLAIALCSFVMGSLVDRYGRWPMLLLSSLGCGCAGTAGYFMDSLYWILASRALLGIFIAGLMTALTTIAGDLFEGQARQRFLGLQSTAMSMGGIVILSLGGILAEISWRLPFFLYSLGFLLFVGFAGFVRETGGRKFRSRQPAPETNGEASHPAKKTSKWLLLRIYLMVMGMAMIYYVLPVQLPFLFGEIGLGAAKAGMALACMAFFSSMGALFFRRLMNLLGGLLALVWIMVNLSIGMFIVGHADSFAMAVVGLAFAGTGLGILMPLGVSLCMAIVSKEHLGLAIGTLTSFLFFGQFMSPVLVSPFLEYFSLGGVFSLFAEVIAVIACVLLAYKLLGAIKANT